MREGGRASEVFDLVILNQLPIDQNLALVDIVHSVEEFERATLPAPVFAHNDADRTSSDLEGEFVDDRRLGPRILEYNIPADEVRSSRVAEGRRTYANSISIPSCLTTPSKGKALARPLSH